MTQQQKNELLQLLITWTRTRKHDVETSAMALENVFDFVDSVADGRVIAFTACALRANDVADHMENTLEQYALLGLAVKP
jgi:hypothetical protein